MTEYLVQHQTTAVVAAAYVISAAVSSLPAPVQGSSEYYRWFYKFSNALLANVSAVRSFPHSPVAPAADQKVQP